MRPSCKSVLAVLAAFGLILANFPVSSKKAILQQNSEASRELSQQAYSSEPQSVAQPSNDEDDASGSNNEEQGSNNSDNDEEGQITSAGDNDDDAERQSEADDGSQTSGNNVNENSEPYNDEEEANNDEEEAESGKIAEQQSEADDDDEASQKSGNNETSEPYNDEEEANNGNSVKDDSVKDQASNDQVISTSFDSSDFEPRNDKPPRHADLALEAKNIKRLPRLDNDHNRNATYQQCCVRSSTCSGCFTMGQHEICNECYGGTSCGECVSLMNSLCTVSCKCSCKRSGRNCVPCKLGSPGCPAGNVATCTPDQECKCHTLSDRRCAPSCSDSFISEDDSSSYF